jgi:hypothetical protein
MAQEQDITFITEDIPPITSFIQAGRSLRLSYAARKEAKYINDILLNNIANPGEFVDPTSFDEKHWETLRASWKQEANVRYPDEGDYRVWIIDPQTGNAVPLGEMVEFIGGDIRETPGGQPCTEYTLDLSGAVVDDPLTFVVGISYEDCFLKPQQMMGTIEELDGLTICVGRGLPYTNLGVFVLGSACDLTYKECAEYFWNLEAYPPLDPVTINYIDCEGVPVSISTTVGSALSNYCGQKDSFTVSIGPIVYVQTCSGGIPETYL